MFRDAIEPSIKVRSRKAYVLPLSVVAHALIIATAIVAPDDVLPMPPAILAFVDTSDPPPPLARAPAPQKPAADANPGAAPLEAPAVVAPESDIDSSKPAVGVVEGEVGGLPTGFVGGVVEGVVPPAPPPQPQSTPIAPVAVGGSIRQPTKIKDVKPVYPALAQAARLQGVVIIEATISATGRVQDARVLRSIHGLDEAALEAVRHWEFTPTLLNGVPVPVVMTVTVDFRLR